MKIFFWGDIGRGKGEGGGEKGEGENEIKNKFSWTPKDSNTHTKFQPFKILLRVNLKS